MAYIGRSVDIGMFEKQVLTPNSSTTTFNLNFAVGAANSLLVVYGGVIQEPNVAYSVSGGGQQIVFSEAPATGTTLYIIYLGKQLTTPRAAGQETTKQTFTGDGTTTVFTLTDAPVVPAGIMVFVDGILQREGSGNNFVSSGSTIAFSSAPDNGAEIDVYTLVKEKVSIDTVADGSITRAKLAASHPYWDAAGNVGINYAAPATLGTLVVSHSGNTTTGVVIGDTTTVASTTGLYLRSSSQGAIAVPTGSSLVFNHGATNPTERARFDTYGGFRVGTTAAINSNNELLSVGSSTQTTNAASFKNSSTTAGTVYLTNADQTANAIQPYLYMSDGSGNRGGFGVTTSTARVSMFGQGGIDFYTGSAGYSNLRISIPSNAAGITFPASQVASSDPNTLDDYEEGTWVPTVNLLGTLTYGNVHGFYQKIGKRVTVSFSFSVSSTDSTQDSVAMYIQGLPFTSHNPTGSSYSNGSSCLMTEGMRGAQSATAPNTFHTLVMPNDTRASVMQNNYNSTLAGRSWFGQNPRSGYTGGTLYIIGQFSYEAAA